MVRNILSITKITKKISLGSFFKLNFLNTSMKKYETANKKIEHNFEIHTTKQIEYKNN